MTMLIEPKIRGFICTTAHPTGCETHVKEQIDYVKAQGSIEEGPKNVLVIGASTGYGLASRISAAFGSGANTLGLYFEREASATRPATAGWYNSMAFEKFAKEEGLYAESLNGDAFSDEMKETVIEKIKADMGGKIDMVVYSLASPRRTNPRTGVTHKSTLKPVGQSFTGTTLNTDSKKIEEVSLEPANEQEIADTVAVMGGEDWEWWIEALDNAGVLNEGCQTVAYTYLGDKLTWPIYGKATIGKAKEDLDRAAAALDAKLKDKGGRAYVGVLKAVVTQASSAIPVLPLYVCLMLKVMREAGTDENPIQQIYRLFQEQIYTKGEQRLDEAGRLRVDEKELDPAVQAKIEELWPQVTSENVDELTDFKGYREEFLKLFGFGISGVNYDEEVDPLYTQS